MFQLDLVGAWREEFNERELEDARLCPNCSKKAIRDLYPGMTDGAVDAHLNMLTNLSGSDPTKDICMASNFECISRGGRLETGSLSNLPDALWVDYTASSVLGMPFKVKVEALQFKSAKFNKRMELV